MLLDPVTRKLIGEGSPFELIGAGAAHREYKIYRHAPGTVTELYERALKRSERELIVFGTTRLTLHRSFAAAERAAALLQERYAIGSGSRVGVVADGTPEWLIAFLAITALGAVPVLIGRRDASQIEHCIDTARCQLVIVDAGVGVSNFEAGANRIDIHDLLAEADRRLLQLSRPRAVHGSDEAVVLFTSGSTGAPKAVSLTHRNLITGLMNMMLGSALAGAEDRDRAAGHPMRPPCALIHKPLCYIGGMGSVLMAVMNGTRVVVTEGWNIDTVGALVAAEGVTAIPNIERAQVEELMAHGDVAHRLISIGLHGASTPRRLIEHIGASVPTLKIFSGYGLTETGGSIAVICGSALRSRPGSSGRIVPTLHVSLGAPEAGRLDESGELFVSGACVTRGYLRAGQVSEIAWFNTGDVARIADDGHLYVDHRSSESAVIDGTRLSTAAVERDLENLEGVAEACILIGTQQPSFDVVVAMSRGRTLERSLIERALPSTIAAADRVRIHFHESLPRTVSGKIDRAALRRTVAAMDDRAE